MQQAQHSQTLNWGWKQLNHGLTHLDHCGPFCLLLDTGRYYCIKLSLYTHCNALLQTAEILKFLIQLSGHLLVVVPLTLKAGHSQLVNLPPEQHSQQKSEDTNDNERLHFGHDLILIKTHQEGVASTPVAIWIMCSRESKRKAKGMSSVASQLKCSSTHLSIDRPPFGLLKESGDNNIVRHDRSKRACDRMMDVSTYQQE